MRILTLAATAALLSVAASAQAATTSIDLGQSVQSYVLYGQGAVSPGIGSFTNQQGVETVTGGVVTDLLSGMITGSSNPGLASGTYDFVTTYTGVPIGSGGTEIRSQTDPSQLQYFYYTAFDPSVSMTLYLYGTPSGDHVIDVASGGNFAADLADLSFSYVTANCTGVASCTQNNVGLTPGATQYGPVTTFVSYTTAAVPEPAAWTLMLAGAGLLGGALRRRGTAVA